MDYEVTVELGPPTGEDCTLILKMEFLVESPIWRALWHFQPLGMVLTEKETGELLSKLLPLLT